MRHSCDTVATQFGMFIICSICNWGRKSNLTPQVKKKVIEYGKQGFGFNKIVRELKVGNGTIINFLKEVA